MTAMNLIVQPKRRAAFLLTDAAYTAPDGRIYKLAGKTIVFERFPAAVGVTGVDIVAALGRELRKSDPRNVRSLLQALPGCMDRALAAFAAVHPDLAEGGALLKVATYSAREKRPAGYLIASNEAMAVTCGLPSVGELHEASSSLSCFSLPTSLDGDPRRIEDPAHFDINQDAFRLVDIQRREPQTSMVAGIDDTIKFRIGGWAELAEVTRHGVKVWRCGEPWSDKIGERISV